jgi:decaprenyl-phosphate phosphoribosyltransferase
MTIVSLLRVHQWLKNGFILAPAFFGGILFPFTDFPLELVAGFFAFSFAASAIYILNDLCDVESDRLHPVKSKRPIPSGKVSINTARVLMMALGVASLGIAWYLNQTFLMLICAYIAINIAYSFGLKKVAILDIIMVSSGFILRVVAGGILASVVVSHWLFIMTALLALFLAIAKRRDDLVLTESTGTQLRKANEGYNLEYVNIVMGMMSAVIIVSYILYITSPEISQRFHGKPLYVSTIFVFAGLLRYLQITLVHKKSGSPTQVLMRDVFTQICIALWVAYFALMIYFVK